MCRRCIDLLLSPHLVVGATYTCTTHVLLRPASHAISNTAVPYSLTRELSSFWRFKLRYERESERESEREAREREAKSHEIQKRTCDRCSLTGENLEILGVEEIARRTNFSFVPQKKSAAFKISTHDLARLFQVDRELQDAETHPGWGQPGHHPLDECCPLARVNPQPSTLNPKPINPQT